MRQYILDERVFAAVYQKLSERPHMEVDQIITALKSCKTVDLTADEKGKENAE